MDKLLALTIPGIDNNPQKIEAPEVVPEGGLETGGGGETALQGGIQLLLVFIAILSVIFLIWGGIKWITASGDKAKLDSARKTIIFSLVGLVLAFASFMIVSLVGNYFGIEFF